jgi:hypothetical protein
MTATGSLADVGFLPESGRLRPPVSAAALTPIARDRRVPLAVNAAICHRPDRFGALPKTRYARARSRGALTVARAV